MRSTLSDLILCVIERPVEQVAQSAPGAARRFPQPEPARGPQHRLDGSELLETSPRRLTPLARPFQVATAAQEPGSGQVIHGA